MLLSHSLGKFAESSNHSRQSFYHPVFQGVYNDYRQRTCYAPVAHKLDYSSKERSYLHMDIKRNGSRPSGRGPAENFTGAVRVDPLFEAPEPARARGASVTFEPGARTAWHTHPLGQTLIVMAGCGRVQRWGGTNRGNSPRRRDLVRARRETLAWSRANHGY